MKKIKCSGHFEVWVDDEDYVWLIEKRWYYVVGRYTEYIISSHPPLYMHIEILKKHGLYTKGKDIRFINGNHLDCQKHNLTMITRSRSVFLGKRTELRGIRRHNKSYRVQNIIDGKYISTVFHNLGDAINYQKYFVELINEMTL